jgi:hypothetical protein
MIQILPKYKIRQILNVQTNNTMIHNQILVKTAFSHVTNAKILKVMINA